MGTGIAPNQVVNPANKRRAPISWWARGWRALPPPRRSPSSATRCPASASRILRGGRTRSRRRAGSRRQELPERGDSVFRLFYDTIKAAISARARHVLPAGGGQRQHHRQCTARGPLRARVWRPAREPLVRGVQVSRTFYARQTGHSCCWVPIRRCRGRSAPATCDGPRAEMLDLVVIDGRARVYHRARPRHGRW